MPNLALLDDMLWCCPLRRSGSGSSGNSRLGVKVLLRERALRPFDIIEPVGLKLVIAFK
jgi:hypothetical protein